MGRELEVSAKRQSHAPTKFKKSLFDRFVNLSLLLFANTCYLNFNRNNDTKFNMMKISLMIGTVRYSEIH